MSVPTNFQSSQPVAIINRGEPTPVPDVVYFHKSASPPVASVGGLLKYTFAIKGGLDMDLEITDTLPNHTAFKEGSATFTVNGKTRPVANSGTHRELLFFIPQPKLDGETAFLSFLVQVSPKLHCPHCIVNAGTLTFGLRQVVSNVLMTSVRPPYASAKNTACKFLRPNQLVPLAVSYSKPKTNVPKQGILLMANCNYQIHYTATLCSEKAGTVAQVVMKSNQKKITCSLQSVALGVYGKVVVSKTFFLKIGSKNSMLTLAHLGKDEIAFREVLITVVRSD